MSNKPSSLASALARVQAKLPQIHKTKTAHVRTDKGSYSYTYADLSDIAPAIHPLLAAEGLAWITMPTITDAGVFVLAYKLVHGESGEEETGCYPLPDPTRVTPQQVGSALTYARRYTICCVTGVVPDEDDDGNVAGDVKAASPPEPERPARTPAAEARADLWTYAEAHGYTTPAQLSAAYQGWSEGGALATAEAEDVRRFLAFLKTEQPA